MSKEELRIAVAECNGFYDFYTKQVLSGEVFPVARLKEGLEHPFKWEPWADGRYSIPDYPEDLNAMHEAEKTLDKDEREHYVGMLLADVPEETLDLNPAESEWLLSTRTSFQRAKAFCRVKGKWKV